MTTQVRSASGLLLCLLLGCAANQPQARTLPEVSARTLYPLAAGNAWSYDVETGQERVLAITRVERADGSSVSVRTGDEWLRYELRPDGIYRPARQGYLLREPIAPGASWDAGAGTRAHIAAVKLAVETAAGRFEDCVRVVEETTTGTRIETTYCPGVGPVAVVSEVRLSRGPVRVSAELRGYIANAP